MASCRPRDQDISFRSSSEKGVSHASRRLLAAAAVMRKTLKPCCSAMPRWLNRLRPDGLVNAAARIPVASFEGPLSEIISEHRQYTVRTFASQTA